MVMKAVCCDLRLPTNFREQVGVFVIDTGGRGQYVCGSPFGETGTGPIGSVDPEDLARGDVHGVQ